MFVTDVPLRVEPLAELSVVLMNSFKSDYSLLSNESKSKISYLEAIMVRDPGNRGIQNLVVPDDLLIG